MTDSPNGSHDKAVNTLNGKNGGSKPKLTRKLATEIAKTIAHSTLSIRQLCSQHPHWPSEFDLSDAQHKFPWWKQLYWDARSKQADKLVNDCLDLEQDLVQNQDRKSMAAVQANRLVMENRRWFASRINRPLYGDDPTVVQNQLQVQVTDQQLSDLRSRLDSARKLDGNVNTPSTGKPVVGKTVDYKSIAPDPGEQNPDTGTGTGTGTNQPDEHD